MTVDLAPLRPLLRELLSGRPLGVLTGPLGSVERGWLAPGGTGAIWEGLRAEELATAQAFESDPVRVWRFYEWRRERLADSRPEAGSLALARLTRLLPATSVATLNVDGRLQAAGVRGVVELNGSLERVRCAVDGGVWPALAAERIAPLPPRCPRCQAPLRPDVVWPGESFREPAWAAALAGAEESALYLVVGTSAVSEPAATLGLAAARAGAKVLEVGAGDAPPSPLVDLAFRVGASELLPALVRELLEASPA